MADWGLKCWDAERNLTLDLSEKIGRVRFQTKVLAGVTGSVWLPDMSGKSTTAFAFSLYPQSYINPKYGHYLISTATHFIWKPVPVSGVAGQASSMIVVTVSD